MGALDSPVRRHVTQPLGFGAKSTVGVLGRRRRRYPSLQPSSVSLHQRRQNDRRGPPFVLYTTRRRPTMTSLRPTSSLDLDAHVGFSPL
jgi:hypothetical protein